MVCRPCNETLDRPVFVQGILVHYGVTSENAQSRKRALQAAYGRKVNRIEVLQSLYEELMIGADDLTRSRLLIGKAVDYYRGGVDPFPVKEEIATMRLLSLRTGWAQIVSQRNSCESCRSLDGTVLAVEEALQEMPIPCKACVYGVSKTEPFAWCRCMYIAVRNPRCR